jgi:predicted NUDIX family NTP pyrophosphohydrolase
MLVRNCAGGVVFYEDQVFLLKNEKGEWVLPKGVIRNGDMPPSVAIERVKTEGGISADIISTAGNTNYEFYSYTRKKPVCNKITWYLMKTEAPQFKINKDEELTDGGFFNIDEALEKITYSQDKSIVSLSYKKYKEM